MFRRSNPKQPPEGQVVYRRIGPPQKTGTSGPKEPRLDPALLPLVAGFALVLLLILLIGNLSIRRIEETSSQALNLGQSFAERNTILLDLRVALTRLDHEARDRAEA